MAVITEDNAEKVTVEEIAMWADGIISAEETPDLSGRSTEDELELAGVIFAWARKRNKI